MAYRKTGKVVAQLEANRARILDAARALVFSGGFQAASMAAVARDAGVATGTLYRYFASREALLLDVFRAVSDAEMSRLEDIAAGPGLPARCAAPSRPMPCSRNPWMVPLRTNAWPIAVAMRPFLNG